MRTLTEKQVAFVVEAIDAALEEGSRTLKLHEEDDTVFDEFSAARNAEVLLQHVGMQRERLVALREARQILLGSEDDDSASG